MPPVLKHIGLACQGRGGEEVAPWADGITDLPASMGWGGGCVCVCKDAGRISYKADDGDWVVIVVAVSGLSSPGLTHSLALLRRNTGGTDRRW